MPKRLDHELDQRKKVILKAVVIDYVETAEPVGSEMLVLRHNIGVKPATVRNELAEMSDMGLLYQPHTSSGRVPSDTGYRYFVDRLMETSPVPRQARERLQSFVKEHSELIPLLSETCRLLAQMTRYISIAATIKDTGIVIHQVLLSPLSATRMLMVVVFNNGHVENRFFDVPETLNLAELAKASEAINAAVSKRAISKLSYQTAPLGIAPDTPTHTIYTRALKLIRNLARDLTRGKLVMAGEINMIEQPEFQRDVERLEMLMRVLDEETMLHETLEKSAESKVSIVIGEENAIEAMHSCSLIASRFYIGAKEAGIIGVLGPKRMRYGNTIPMVDVMAKTLSEALTWLTNINNE